MTHKISFSLYNFTKESRSPTFTLMWESAQEKYVSQLYFIVHFSFVLFYSSDVGTLWWLLLILEILVCSKQPMHPDQIVLTYIVQQQSVSKDEMVMAIKIPCLMVGESEPIQSKKWKSKIRFIIVWLNMFKYHT